MKTHTFSFKALAAALCLLAVLAAGCSSNGNNGGSGGNNGGNAGASGDSGTAAQQNDGAAAASDGSGNAVKTPDTSPVTLTAIMEPQLVQNKWGEDDVSKELQAKTGVTMDITFQATWDDKQLSTMLASGSELPDFIIIDTQGSQALANTLVSQGYVQPLNKLAEQYSPEFLQYLPKDMDQVYGAADGNFYGVGDLYGDYSRTGDLKVSSFVDSGLAIQTGLLEKAGNPSIDTLADFKAAVAKIKADNPDLHNPIMIETGDPTNYRSMVQIVNKIYGGQNVISIGADDTVHLNFKDEAYVNALKYIGDLYRSKLIPAESFTMTDEQRKQALTNNDVFAYFGFYQNLGTKIPATFTSETPYWAVDLPTAPDVPRDQIKLFDSYAGTGGWHTVFISKDSKHPDRAIQYLAYLLSDEGQLLQRLGVKDKGYVDDPGGSGYAFSDTRKDYAKNDPAKLATELGIDNWNWTWLEQFHTVMIGEELNAKELPAMQDYYDKYVKYAYNERINLLTAKLTDSDMIVLRAKIDDLWKNSYPKIVLADSEAKLMEEYNKFLGQAETLGLSKLEAAYTENYKSWKQKLEQ